MNLCLMGKSCLKISILGENFRAKLLNIATKLPAKQSYCYSIHSRSHRYPKSCAINKKTLHCLFVNHPHLSLKSRARPTVVPAEMIVLKKMRHFFTNTKIKISIPGYEKSLPFCTALCNEFCARSVNLATKS